jgi:hypothetical protein
VNNLTRYRLGVIRSMRERRESWESIAAHLDMTVSAASMLATRYGIVQRRWSRWPEFPGIVALARARHAADVRDYWTSTDRTLRSA